LRAQASSIRAELNVVGQLESKQGWVVGTAKMAVVAPWIIVALLSVRPENAAIYNSTNGATILLVGFLVSIFAYRLVHVIGALPAAPRVFSL
jgi:tight adherence protein B